MNITINYPDKSKQEKIENIPEKIQLCWEGHKKHKTCCTHNNTKNLDLYLGGAQFKSYLEFELWWLQLCGFT